MIHIPGDTDVSPGWMKCSKLHRRRQMPSVAGPKGLRAMTRRSNIDLVCIPSISTPSILGKLSALLRPWLAYHRVSCRQAKSSGPTVPRADSQIVDRQFSELRDEFPWQRFNGGRVVDVGGGSGHVSIYLAKVKFHSFPMLLLLVRSYLGSRLTWSLNSNSPSSPFSSKTARTK